MEMTKVLEATKEEKAQKPKENMFAFIDLLQFTQEEAIKWLEVEEKNAIAIARDCEGRAVGGAYPATVRAEACSTLRVKISKAKGKKVWDLEEELGKIQDKVLGRQDKE